MCCLTYSSYVFFDSPPGFPYADHFRYAPSWPVSSADWQDSATFHWTGRGGVLMFLAYSGRQRLRLLWQADETTKGSMKIFATPSGLRGHLGLGGTGPSLGEVAAMTTLVSPTFPTLPCQGAFLAPPPTCAQGDANTLSTSPLPQHTRVVLRSKSLPDPHSSLVLWHTTIHNRHTPVRVGL